jgi:serine/threonine protein kinase
MKECPVCKRCFPDEINHCPQDGDATTQSLLGEPVLDGRYQLEKRLGQGEMGVVFQARHIFLKTSHAIKVILPDLVGNDPMLVTRFRQEALSAAAIRHQNIIAVTDFGVVRGTMPFLVMEYVSGKSLQDILSEEKRMSPQRALEFICAIGAGVGAAHRQNIVHRDLKPLNIIVQSGVSVAEGLKILDFGLARIKSGELLGSFVQAKTTGLIGSPFYMAPEQWSDEEPDSRADVYSLGIILYQMLSGDVPFKGSSIPSIMKKHLTLPPPSFRSVGVEVTRRLEAVVFSALEKDVEERTATVEDFIDEVRAAVEAGGMTTQYGGATPNRTSSVVRNTAEPEEPAATQASIGMVTGHSLQDEFGQEELVSSGREVLESEATPTARTPIYLDEDVQFTVYKPKRVRPQKWYTLLAYAHLSERRPGEDEADPIERMEVEVKKILGEQKFQDYGSATEGSSQSIPRRGEITFVPFIPGVEFNPPSQSFFWRESVHGQEFRMMASAALDGKTARGRVSVFLGSILLAEINISLRVDSAQVRTDEPVPLVGEKPARPYRNIFPSYSHRDREIVAQIAHYAEITGDKYMLDMYELRSGQNWKKWMYEKIEGADIFQLFWSTNSMRSENVKLEWQHALRLGRENFIRPTYWENPLPKSPSDNLPPPELLDLHFHQIRSPLSVSVGGSALPVQGAKLAESREPSRRAQTEKDLDRLALEEPGRSAEAHRLIAELMRKEEQERVTRKIADREERERQQREQIEGAERQAKELEERHARRSVSMPATGVSIDREATQLNQGRSAGPLSWQSIPPAASLPPLSCPDALNRPHKVWSPILLIGVFFAIISLIIAFIVVLLVIAIT